MSEPAEEEGGAIPLERLGTAPGGQMKVFHRTDAAEAILEGGFRDGTGSYLTGIVSSGVWVSDRPLDANEGACGRFLLEMEIPAAVFEEHEWVEEGATYRESLVPAEILNGFGRPVVIETDPGAQDR